MDEFAGRGHHHLHEIALRLPRGLVKAFMNAVAGIVDEEVNRDTVTLQRIHQLPTGLCNREIAGPRPRGYAECAVQLMRQCSEPVGTSSRQYKVKTMPCQKARHRGADSCRGPSHQSGFTRTLTRGCHWFS